MGTLEVTRAPHALPTQTDEQMRAAHGTAQGRAAPEKRGREQIPPWDAGYGKGGKDDRRRIEELEAVVRDLRLELDALTNAASTCATPDSTHCEIDETILDRVDATRARSLCRQCWKARKHTSYLSVLLFKAQILYK